MTDTPKSTTDNGDTHNKFCGKPGRSGPPVDNTNAMRHGLRAGKLPAGCEYIANRMNGFRRRLEAAVIDVAGEVSIPAAASIQTALRWERHAALALHWLRHQHDSLSAVERLTFSREIARASAERDKAIASLGLDAPGRLPWLESPRTEGPKNEQSAEI